MARDKIDDRYQRKEKKSLLGGLFKRTVDPDLLSEEERIVENAEKVEPILGRQEPGRNDPCPCGSGKKFKKCCWNEGKADTAQKK
jgi:uncharacterized protein YchJ